MSALQEISTDFLVFHNCFKPLTTASLITLSLACFSHYIPYK